MCFVDDYDFYFHRVSTVTARKPHRCGECEGAIAVGERHLYAIGWMEGGVEQFRSCAACNRLRDAVKRYEIEVEGCAPSESVPPFGILREYVEHDVTDDVREMIERFASETAAAAAGPL